MTTKSFRITPVYDLLLRGSSSMPIGLYQLHLATAEQLTRLHYKPGTIKTVKARLKVLTDNGFIQADSVPTKQLRAPYYYTMSDKGVRYLADIGLDVADSFRAAREVNKHYLFLDHALELNNILIAALRLKYADPRFYLSRFVPERILKRTPYRAMQDGTSYTLIPDMLLDFRKRPVGGEGVPFTLLIEHDRGTEEQQHFKRRIRAYKAFLQSGAYKQLFGVGDNVAVAFTTFTGMRRVTQMREWTRQEVGSDGTLTSMLLFGDLPRVPEPRGLLFERRWYILSNAQPIALLEE
jgi:DNA-binding PadR family transcriptional regulator